ncbi:MAG: hypothetical protein JST79_01095 [Acidobacteria bacterium]|nr:hypothetical protein [Acidobacteriota bacterium]
MNKIAVSLCTGFLLSGLCFAQTSASTKTDVAASQSASVSADHSGAQASSNTSATATQGATASGGNSYAHGSSQLQSGSAVQAELTKPVDARKNKPGDEVMAKTTQDVKSNGHVVLPKGSKIVGKVTQAQARTKGQEESQLGIAFDHAILKDGTQVPMAFAIQAISGSQAAASIADDSTMESVNTGSMATASASGTTRGLVGGVASTTGNVVHTAGSTTGATLHTATATGLGANGAIASSTQGVVGMPGMTLSSVASNSTGASSVLSSRNSNVHLDTGTRMLLRATGK